MISLDARSGYHQVNIRPCDQDSLAFSTSCGKNKIFKVVPFGHKNVPVLYTIMMQTLCEDWLILIAETKNGILIVNPPSTILCDDKIITDDILLFSNHEHTLLHYFSYIS